MSSHMGDTKLQHFEYSLHHNLVEDNEDTMSYYRPFGESNQKVIFPSPEKVLYALGKI